MSDPKTTEKTHWMADGAFVYRLHQTGWDKGKPLMTNEYTIQVQASHDVKKSRSYDIAEIIADALNAKWREL